MHNPSSHPPDAGNGEGVVAVTTVHSPLARTTKDLAALERGISHYPDEIRTGARWLQGFYLDHCQANVNALRALAFKVGGRQFDKSEEWFYNIIGGYYFTSKQTCWKEGGRAWAEFRELIESLRKYSENAARTGQIPFVETPTYRCIADFITAKRALSAVCKFGGITGPTGSQKSESLKRYRDLNNHGAVVHLEAPARPAISALTLKIAACYHAKSYQVTSRPGKRELAIRENVNNTRCLIIDNAQRLYDERRGSSQPCFNYLLELQDDTRCTIILSFTEEFLKEDLIAGAAKDYFEQFLGRMGGLEAILRLPEHTPAADLRVISRAFGLGDGKGAMDFLHKWSRQRGRVRIVFDKLQLAQEFARADGRSRITLADLEEADGFVPPSTGSDEGGVK